MPLTNGAVVACMFFLSPFEEPEWTSTTMTNGTTSDAELIINYGMRWRTNEVFRISTDDGFFTAIRRTFQGPLVNVTNTTVAQWQSWTGTNPPTSLPPSTTPGRPTSTVGAPVSISIERPPMPQNP